MYYELSIKQSFAYTQLNGQRVPYIIIWINVSHLLAYRLSVKHSSIRPIDP